MTTTTLRGWAAAATLISITFGGAVLAQDAVELSAALPTPPGSSRVEVAERFAEEVASLSEGSLSIMVFPSGQLYDDSGAPQALASGALDMAFPNLAHLARFEPNADLLSLPMVIGSDAEAVYALFDGALGAEIMGRVEARLRSHALSGIYAPGPAADFTRGIEVTKFSDLEGLNIRMPGSPVILAVGKAMGVSPVGMSTSDMMIALSQGRLDGLMTTIQAGNSFRVWEAGVSNVWVDGSDWSAYVPLISNATWDGLSEEHRTVLKRAWAAMLPEAREIMAADLQASVEGLKAQGVFVSYADDAEADAMRARLMEQQPDIIEAAGMDVDLMTRAAAALDEFRAAER